MPAVIRQLDLRRDLDLFIKCQWAFYKDDPQWVPPVIADRRKLLNLSVNPFYRHAEIGLFVAERGGTIVGRIAAITNDNHNTTHHDSLGFFGFFECENNIQTASLLFDVAQSWLSVRNKTAMRGPVNPSMNDETGLLIHGFDSPPVVLATYNPPYYADLMEACGLTAAKDLFSYLLTDDGYASDKLQRLQLAIRQRHDVTVRSVRFGDKQGFRQDVVTLKRIYNSAWTPNWGFVKMDDAEFDFLAADLKQIADPDYTLIAEVSGQPVGFALALPDINQSLIHNRRGTLLGALWCLLTKKKLIDTVRIIVLGLIPEYQKTGIDAVLYYEIGQRGIAKGIRRAEASWVLEDNVMMNRALQQTVNGRLYKKHRLYEREFV